MCVFNLLIFMLTRTCTNIPSLASRFVVYVFCLMCDIVVYRSNDQSSPDRERALEEQLRAAELRERETQQHCDRLLLEKDQELGTKNQELLEANHRCAEAQQTVQDAHR